MAAAPGAGAGAGEGAAMPERAHKVCEYWLGPDYASHPDDGAFWPDGAVTSKWFKGGKDLDDEIRAAFAADLEALEGGELDAAWRVAAGAPPHAQLAGVVVMDQFSRNAYRGTARAFALDAKAREWAAELRALPEYRAALPGPHRYFCLLPLMHSEALADQELLVSEVAQELALALEKSGGADGGGASGGGGAGGGAHQDEEAKAGGRKEEEAGGPAAPAPAAAAESESPAVKMWRSILRYGEAHRDVVARWGRFPHRNQVLGRAATAEEAAGLESGAIPRW